MHPEDIEADPVPGELLVYQKGMKRVAVLGGGSGELPDTAARWRCRCLCSITISARM